MALAIVLALAQGPEAQSHAGLTPPAVVAGTATTITVEIPNERRGRSTVGLTIRIPQGISVVASAAPPGWSAAVGAAAGSTSDGATEVGFGNGRLSGENVARFELTLRADVPPGTYELNAKQRYDDAKEVSFAANLVVLPASGETTPDQHAGRALIAALVGLGVVTAALAALQLRRRRVSGAGRP